MDYFRNSTCSVEECLRNISIDNRIIHEIVLVFGTTQIPKVQTIIQEFFNVKVSCESIINYR